MSNSTLLQEPPTSVGVSDNAIPCVPAEVARESELYYVAPRHPRHLAFGVYRRMAGRLNSPFRLCIDTASYDGGLTMAKTMAQKSPEYQYAFIGAVSRGSLQESITLK